MWADAQLVAFAHTSTAALLMQAGEGVNMEGSDHEAGNKLFFKIDGPSSRCVRDVWRRAGGVRTRKGGWNLWWGRPLKYAEHKKLNVFQRVCHFPGTWYLGRKVLLAASSFPLSMPPRARLALFRGCPGLL